MRLVRIASRVAATVFVRRLTVAGSGWPQAEWVRQEPSGYIRSPMDRRFEREPMTILTVKRVTTYSYAASVRLGEHRMMLRPRDSNDQQLLDATLDIEPRAHSVRWIHDVFDNCVAIANFTGNTRSLRVESNITLEHTPFEEPEVLLEHRARYYPFSSTKCLTSLQRSSSVTRTPPASLLVGFDAFSIKDVQQRPARC